MVIGVVVVSFMFVNSLQPTYAKKTISDASGFLTTVANESGIAQKDVPTVTGEIIANMLLMTSLVFFILMVYAGFRWMLSRGNEELVTSSRKTIVYATIGLFVVGGSYAITNFVSSRIVEGNGNSGGFVNSDNADYTNLGCCFDRVRHPGKWGELKATTWAWRITSQGKCQEEGEKPTSFDELYGPNEWQFTDVKSKDQCELLYASFCQNNKCYDLGWSASETTPK